MCECVCVRVFETEREREEKAQKEGERERKDHHQQTAQLLSSFVSLPLLLFASAADAPHLRKHAPGLSHALAPRILPFTSHPLPPPSLRHLISSFPPPPPSLPASRRQAVGHPIRDVTSCQLSNGTLLLSFLDARHLRLVIPQGSPQADAVRLTTRLEQMMHMGSKGTSSSLQRRVSSHRQQADADLPMGSFGASLGAEAGMSGLLGTSLDADNGFDDDGDAGFATFTEEGPLGGGGDAGGLLADWDDAAQFDSFASPPPAFAAPVEELEQGQAVPVPMPARGRELPRDPIGYGTPSTPPSEASSLADWRQAEGRAGRRSGATGAAKAKATGAPAPAASRRRSPRGQPADQGRVARAPSIGEEDAASAVSVENTNLSKQTLAEVQEELEAHETRGPASEPSTSTGIPIGARCGSGQGAGRGRQCRADGRPLFFSR